MTTYERGAPRVAMPRLGPYRLVEELGTGGMGVVHLALDRGGRAVALKVLRPTVAEEPEARARLEREVATLGRITDPRVAAVIDADLTGTPPYLVTRFVPGPSLEDLVGDDGPLDPPALLAVARGLAGALESIHAVGVVHRDVKPSNVLVDDDGDPVLIDFGIAHLTDDVRITLTGLVMGTPGYLSPEVINGGAVTDATDWWGWAATLAFAASGTPPFGRGSMEAVLARVRSGDFDLSGVDRRLAPLLAAALTVDAARRPHATAVLAALERYAAGEDATVVVPADPTVAVPAPAAVTVVVPADVAATQPVSPVGTRELPSPSVPSVPSVPSGPSTVWPGTPVASVPPAPPAPGQRSVPPNGPQPVRWPQPAGDPESAAYADPRIGRESRTGTIVALGALLVAVAAGWPAVAVIAAVFLRWVAGTADRAVTSLVLRRYAHGVRPSDLAVTVLRSPWHVVVGALAGAVSMILPAVVGVASSFCVALVTQLVTGQSAGPDRPLPLAVGMGAAIVMGWIGPGGASLRRGLRSVVRGVTPSEVSRDVAVAVIVALVVVALGVLLYGGAGVTWWPLSGSPWASLVGA